MQCMELTRPCVISRAPSRRRDPARLGARTSGLQAVTGRLHLLAGNYDGKLIRGFGVGGGARHRGGLAKFPCGFDVDPFWDIHSRSQKKTAAGHVGTLLATLTLATKCPSALHPCRAEA